MKLFVVLPFETASLPLLDWVGPERPLALGRLGQLVKVQGEEGHAEAAERD